MVVVEGRGERGGEVFLAGDRWGGRGGREEGGLETVGTKTKTKEEAAVNMKRRRTKMEDMGADDDEKSDEDVTEKHGLEEQTPVPDREKTPAMVKFRGDNILSRGEPLR